MQYVVARALVGPLGASSSISKAMRLSIPTVRALMAAHDGAAAS